MTSNAAPTEQDDLDARIGAAVHTALWAAHRTHADLAKALGLDQAAVSRRLRGRTAWRIADLVLVAFPLLLIGAGLAVGAAAAKPQQRAG